jgi:hypothetical protein
MYDLSEEWLLLRGKVIAMIDNKALGTDSSEYKMWGNGIALPNALYVMQGIADVMSEEKAARRKWLNDLLGGCL